MTRLIVVDATAYGPEPGGARRRCVELMRRLPGRMPDDVFEMHWAADGGGPDDDLRADNLVHATVQTSCRGGARRWRRRRRELRARHRAAPFTDLIVDHGPVLRRTRTHVTVHDLRFLHGYGGRLRAMYGRLGYGRVLRRAARVVTVSDAMRDEVAGAYGISGAHLVAVPNAASSAFAPASRETAREGALVVARDEPRKARGAAEAAASAAGMPLQIVDDERDEGRLVEHYRRAKWLLAPSLYEGFHMPVVEALACGTPVIASDIAAHRDLVARGASGLVLVPAPQQAQGWQWPEAVAALGAPPPTQISPPAWTWDDAAAAWARVLT